METRNYMVMYKLTNNSVIHTEYYVTEELARKDANRMDLCILSCSKRAESGTAA